MSAGFAELPIFLLLGHGNEHPCTYSDLPITACPFRERVPENTYLILFTECGRVSFMYVTHILLQMFADKNDKTGVSYEDMLKDMVRLPGDSCGGIIDLDFCRKYGPTDEMPSVTFYPGKFGDTTALQSGVMTYSTYPKHQKQVQVMDETHLSSDERNKVYENSVYPTSTEVRKTGLSNLREIGRNFKIGVRELMVKLGPGIYLASICRATESGDKLESSFAQKIGAPIAYSRGLPLYEMTRKLRDPLTTLYRKEHRIRTRSRERSLAAQSPAAASKPSKKSMVVTCVVDGDYSHPHRIKLPMDATITDLEDVLLMEEYGHTADFSWFIDGNSMDDHKDKSETLQTYKAEHRLPSLTVHVVTRYKLEYTVSFKGYTIPTPYVAKYYGHTTLQDLDFLIGHRHGDPFKLLYDGEEFDFPEENSKKVVDLYPAEDPTFEVIKTARVKQASVRIVANNIVEQVDMAETATLGKINELLEKKLDESELEWEYFVQSSAGLSSRANTYSESEYNIPIWSLFESILAKDRPGKLIVKVRGSPKRSESPSLGGTKRKSKPRTTRRSKSRSKRRKQKR